MNQAIVPVVIYSFIDALEGFPARVATSPAAQPTCENYNLHVSLIDIVEDSFAKTVNKLDGFD